MVTLRYHIIRETRKLSENPSGRKVKEIMDIIIHRKTGIRYQEVYHTYRLLLHNCGSSPKVQERNL